MTIESTAIKIVNDTVNVAEKMIKKVWSIMDEVSEKPQPSKILSLQAIESIQGKTKQNN